MVYIFIGEEDLLKEEALDRLKQECFPSENEDSLTFNYVSLHGLSAGSLAGESTTSKQVVEEAQQLPFMSPRRLVIVRDAEQLIDETLLDYIQNPLKTTCLVLLMRKIDKRLSSYRTLKANAKIVEFNHLRQDDLVKWIQCYVNQYDKTISYNNAGYIANTLENNLSGILQELEKLIAYIGTRNTITIEDIELSISENKIKGSFELTDAIQYKDTSCAIRLVNNLLDQGKSVQEVIGSMRWMLTRLWQGKELLKDKRLSTVRHVKRAISEELHISYYFVDKFIDQAERFSIPELKNGLNTLLNLQKLMRTYTLPNRLLLECLVIQLAEPSLNTQIATNQITN